MSLSEFQTFQTFTLASPEGITALNTAAVPAADYTQCLIDAFSISAPNAVGSPVICGANSGYRSKEQRYTSHYAPETFKM